MLKEHNVDVYFEEQGIHSIQPGAEFYITIYGSIAQSESENISANVRWGKAQSAKEGNVPFHYKRFLGYRRGSDGKPEIDPEQAVVVKRIYERFLAGDSLATIANDLNADEIPTPSRIGQWQRGTIESILTNEKYKGDAILNKTYIRDCLSKKVSGPKLVTQIGEKSSRAQSMDSDVRKQKSYVIFIYSCYIQEDGNGFKSYLSCKNSIQNKKERLRKLCCQRHLEPCQ